MAYAFTIVIGPSSSFSIAHTNSRVMWTRLERSTALRSLLQLDPAMEAPAKFTKASEPSIFSWSAPNGSPSKSHVFGFHVTSIIFAELFGCAVGRFRVWFRLPLPFSFCALLPLRTKRTTVCPSRTSESVSADPTSPLEPAITIFMRSPSSNDATHSEPPGQGGGNPTMSTKVRQLFV